MNFSREDHVLSLSDIEYEISQKEKLLKSRFEEFNEHKGSYFSKNVLSKEKEEIIRHLFHLYQLKHSIEKGEDTKQYNHILSLLSVKNTTKEDKASKWTITVEYNKRTVTFFIQRPTEQLEEDLLQELFNCHNLNDIVELDISLTMAQRKDT